eukprot:jgi/Psemu1/164990/gw1.181.104.1
MDVIIPGPSIRSFCAAIGCLSRIGKELYIDFDPIDGLSIRSLNDSKSVFGSFHFEPAFFFRCRSAPTYSDEILSTSARRRKRKINQQSRNKDSGNDIEIDIEIDNDNDNDDSNDDDERWTVRIAMKALAAVVRQRKEILNLRITTQGDHLSFEFKIQKIGGSVVRVTHKVGYSSAQGVAAVTATDGSSELVVQPTVLTTMLEPLKRSIEIAILVNETHRLVSSVSFAHDDLPGDGVPALNPEQQNASLKTETSVSYDDLVEVHYVGSVSRTQSQGNTSSDTSAIEPPGDIDDQVVLVFTLKEFKAFLQYCSHALVDQELQVTIQFFWGGRPIVAKTVGDQFSAELVMATLDHNLLGSMKTSATSV